MDASLSFSFFFAVQRLTRSQTEHGEKWAVWAAHSHTHSQCDSLLLLLLLLLLTVTRSLAGRKNEERKEDSLNVNFREFNCTLWVFYLRLSTDVWWFCYKSRAHRALFQFCSTLSAWGIPVANTHTHINCDTNKQTDRQTDIHTHTQHNTHTHTLIYFFKKYQYSTTLSYYIILCCFLLLLHHYHHQHHHHYHNHNTTLYTYILLFNISIIIQANKS